MIEPQPGVTGRVVQSDQAQLVVYDYAPKTVVETHKHDVEEFGVVVKGSVAMVIAGEQRILICLTDTIDWPTSFLGAVKAGVVAVPVNTLMGEAE